MQMEAPDVLDVRKDRNMCGRDMARAILDVDV